MIEGPPKQERVLEAATDVFSRYGFARTTMADIASAAGISRPALYLLFADKEAIFTSVIERMDARKLRSIAQTLPGLPTLEGKLLSACLDWGLHGVEMAEAHPDAADLFDLRFPVVRRAYANFEALIVRIVREPVARAGLTVTAEDMAHVLTYGMLGLRAASDTVDEMRRLLVIHVGTFVRAIDGDIRGASSDGDGPCSTDPA